MSDILRKFIMRRNYQLSISLKELNIYILIIYLLQLIDFCENTLTYIM